MAISPCIPIGYCMKAPDLSDSAHASADPELLKGGWSPDIANKLQLYLQSEPDTCELTGKLTITSDTRPSISLVRNSD